MIVVRAFGEVCKGGTPVAKDFYEMYGRKWPTAMMAHQVELTLWKKHKELVGQADLLNPVEEHLYKAIEALFTKSQFTPHPWWEIQAHSWTYDTFALWWGAAGSGKSHSLGLLVLLDFLAAPECTYSLLASTSKEMLARRSFAFVVKYLSYLKTNRQFEVPFKFVPSKMVVIPESADEEEISNLQHMIVGVAVQQGTESEARANLQGVHTRYVRAVFDELSGMRSAAMESRHNLSQCFDFRLFGACNPESIYDEAGKYSTPLAGWNSVSLDSLEWETPWGKVYRFDGLRSPGIKEPEKYPFLPTQKYVDNILKANNGNMDAPAIWTFLRAFPPPQGTERTVLTEGMVKAYNMLEPITFRDSYIKVAALDPAFTADGDDCKLLIGRVGMSTQGVMTLLYDREYNIDIRASDPRPVTEQITTRVVEILKEEDVSDEYVAVDDSGTQSVADALAMKYGNRLVRFNYAGKPPDLPVSISNPELASKKYKNIVTWCYYTVKEYGERGQIKGLPRAAAEEMCKRRVGTKQQPHQLESKKEHKKRLGGRSPDSGDCCAMMAGLCRLKIGLVPGATVWNPGGQQDPAILAPEDTNHIRELNNLQSTYSSEICVDTGSLI